VNLSAAELVADDLLARIREVLAHHGASPKQIGFEWTESGVLTDRARALTNLQHLDRLGCHLAIDDFGTGYASLSHLQEVPAAELKIDRAFVATAADQTDTRGKALRAAVMTLARGFNLLSTAEGIETAAQLHALCDLECDRGKGSSSPALPLRAPSCGDRPGARHRARCPSGTAVGRVVAVANVRAILRRADRIGLDPWRVLVALESRHLSDSGCCRGSRGSGDRAQRQPGRNVG
jgi:predicted signal transduction protein with EAL and GGDEF domain